MIMETFRKAYFNYGYRVLLCSVGEGRGFRSDICGVLSIGKVGQNKPRVGLSRNYETIVKIRRRANCPVVFTEKNENRRTQGRTYLLCKDSLEKGRLVSKNINKLFYVRNLE